MKYNYSV